MLLDWFPVSYLRGLALVWGLLWGSFLNVVIYRVPREMSVVRPASHCPGCGQPVKAWMNIPVLSYLVLRGRTSCCGTRLSPRYPLVEAIGGLLSIAIVESVILTMPRTTSVGHALALYCAYFTVALALVAAAFIDIEHMYLPDSITYGGVVIGVLTATLRQMEFTTALIGAVVGFAVIWLPFILLYKLVRGSPGMGLGDAKLMALAGAWFGWEGSLAVLGLAGVQGTAITMLLLAFRGKLDEPEAVIEERAQIRAELDAMTPEERELAERELMDDPLALEPEEGVGKARIAFGPFLVLAILEFMLFGPFLMEQLFGGLGP